MGVRTTSLVAETSGCDDATPLILQEAIMRRRNFLGTTAGLGGLGLLAACAPGSDSGSGDGGGDGGGGWFGGDGGGFDFGGFGE